MKKLVFLLAVVVFAVMLSSCNNTAKEETTVTTTTKVTATELGTQGFILKKVVKGDNLWGYSQEVYGSGIQWREIVAENPFLNNPLPNGKSRIYYDEKRGWIVIILPGETIKIGGKTITPTYVSEETTIEKTTKTTPSSYTWWQWFGVLVALSFIGLLIWLIWRPRHTPGVVVVNLDSVPDIRIATLTAIENDRRAHTERMADKFLSHGKIDNIVHATEDHFFAIQYKNEATAPTPVDKKPEAVAEKVETKKVVEDQAAPAVTEKPEASAEQGHAGAEESQAH